MTRVVREMAGIDSTDAQPASARQGASTATCAVLHRIYGAHRVHSLQGALLRIVQGVPALRDTLARTLAQPGDAAAYSEFLQQSLVVLPNPLPSLSPLATLEQSMTLSEVKPPAHQRSVQPAQTLRPVCSVSRPTRGLSYHVALQAVMRTVNLLVQSGQENNVLRTGYRKVRVGQPRSKEVLSASAQTSLCSVWVRVTHLAEARGAQLVPSVPAARRAVGPWQGPCHGSV